VGKYIITFLHSLLFDNCNASIAVTVLEFTLNYIKRLQKAFIYEIKFVCLLRALKQLKEDF